MRRILDVLVCTSKMNFWYRYVPYMYLLPHYIVVIDGRRYDFEFAGITPSHRHTVTVYTKVESRLSATRVYKKYPLFNSTSKVDNFYNRISTTYFYRYLLTAPQIPVNYNPLFINKIPPRIHPMTSYPSTELPLCGESNRKQNPPPPSSKYLLLSPS